MGKPRGYLQGFSAWAIVDAAITYPSYFKRNRRLKVQADEGSVVGACECGGMILKSPESGKERCATCKRIGRFK